MLFSKYILQFIKDTDKEQTHLSFNKGKYNVPEMNFSEFYKRYYNSMIKNEELFLIEKIYNSNFLFFLDLDAPKNSSIELNDFYVKQIIQMADTVIRKMFIIDSENITDYIVSKRQNKYHVNFYNLTVNSQIANEIANEIKMLLENEIIASCIDTSVYRTGLRLLGSKKQSKNQNKQCDITKNIYHIYNLETQSFIKLQDTSFDDFMKTIVRPTKNMKLTTLLPEFNNLVFSEKIQKNNKNIETIDNEKIKNELVSLLDYVKISHPNLVTLNTNINNIRAKHNKNGMFCYYISIQERHCPFKLREHQRESFPIYIELASNGISVRCYDHDCIGQRFPKNGIPLPTDFENMYPQLYLSMTTKYWKSQIHISDEIKHYLEESLSGSHYQIAKTAFKIYIDNFRVDDVKNPIWYEFDGVRWNRSHKINILISEELPKYYEGIKIRDTSFKNNDLQEFLTNDDKIHANLRNQTVDQIITRLENVNFKNNILTQLSYLYKNHDQDFYTNLDSNPYLIGFKNGVYDFQQNIFRSSNQSDYITFSTGYEYIDYDESLPQVKEIYDFLSKIITDTHVREYLLKILGKSLIGIPEEKFYIWTGLSGANGKSTLVNFLEATLGDYTTSVDVSLLTNKRANSSNASPDIIRLRGRRLFTFQEPEHDDKLRTGILKQYTGGDTIIARELFKSPITFKLQGTMVMCCNDLPAVASIDGGTWRRIRVIEFKSRFCENPIKDNEFPIDPTIKGKLKEWRPYFMSILIHWYNKYLYEGIYEPEEVKRATDKYKVENDKFNEFFDEMLEESNNGFETVKNIYVVFQNWWSLNYPNTRIPETKDLKRAMKIKYGEKEKTTNGIKQLGFYIKTKFDGDDILSDKEVTI